MEKILKTPKFLIRLLDAFILRLPFAYIVVSFVVSTIIGQKSFSSKQNIICSIMLVFVFAFIHALLYVSIFPRRTRSKRTMARLGEGFFVFIAIVAIFSPYMSSFENGQPGSIYSEGVNYSQLGFEQYFKDNIIGNPLYLIMIAWIVYMLMSETIKGQNEKRSRRRVPASEDPTYKTFAEMSCVYLSLMKFGSACSKKKYDVILDNINRSSSQSNKSEKPKARTNENKQAKAQKHPTGNKRISSGNRVGIDFFDSEAMTDYKKYLLTNHAVICLSGSKAFVVMYLEKRGDYRLTSEGWFRNDKRTANYTAELDGIIRTLKNKCGVSRARGVIAKAFDGGSIPTDILYDVVDVSKSYDALERDIKSFMPAADADKQQTAECAKNITKEFRKRFAVEKKEEQ